MNSKNIKQISLYFKSGTSDKVYNCWIREESPGSFTLQFSFGRRGNTFQTGTKTAKPVDYETAVKIYEKLVREKLSKGYTPVEDGTPYQDTEQEDRSTGIFPQLLTPIDEVEAERLIFNDDWWMQEKFDGKRIMIRKEGEQIDGINRKGLVVALPEPIVEGALLTRGDWLMDGESIGDIYAAFDLLEQDNEDLRIYEYRQRFVLLARILGANSKNPIRIVNTTSTENAKREMLAKFRQENREGVVFKRASAPYTVGRGPDQLKLKFTATASCIVDKVNGKKRSVALVLKDGRKRVAVGNVTIPPNKDIPEAGSIIEVRYLYAYPGGSLYQPVYLEQRDDISLFACTLDQLKYKAGSEENGEL